MYMWWSVYEKFILDRLAGQRAVGMESSEVRRRLKAIATIGYSSGFVLVRPQLDQQASKIAMELIGS